MTISNLIDFVFNLLEWIGHYVKIVNENELVAKSKLKLHYNKHAQEVIFQEGDLVLLLLPLVDKSLQAKYCGHFEIVQRLGEFDYLINTLDERKV